MTIVSFRQDDPRLAEMTPEREARLNALADIPDSEIVFNDDVPKMTEEQLAGFRPWNEVMAERRAQRKQVAAV